MDGNYLLFYDKNYNNWRDINVIWNQIFINCMICIQIICEVKKLCEVF